VRGSCGEIQGSSKVSRFPSLRIVLARDKELTLLPISRPPSQPINAVSIKKSRPYRAVTASDDASLVLFTGVPFKSDKVRSPPSLSLPIPLPSPLTIPPLTTGHKDPHQLHPRRPVLPHRSSLRERRIGREDVLLQRTHGGTRWRAYQV
jgi:hypothetical protein